MHGMPKTYSRCDAITGSDTVQQHFSGLICLATGNVTFRARDSAANVTVTGAPVGLIIPIETILVLLTGITGSWGGLA